MSYHHSMGEPFVIPPQPTEAEIARNRAIHNALDTRFRSGATLTREDVLYMLDTLPIVGCFGGPVPEFPTGVREAVTPMAPGAVVPYAMVKRVFAAWNPGDVRRY